MLLSFFRLSLAIRNVWPRHMNFKAFSALYILLLAAGMPVTLFACVPYGLFGILAAVCIYGLVTCRDTAPQNVFMGMIGCVLAVMTENLLSIFLYTLIPSPLSDQWYFFFRRQFDLYFSVLLDHAAFRQAAEKNILVWQRYFAPFADVVCDRRYITAPYHHLSV